MDKQFLDFQNRTVNALNADGKGISIIRETLNGMDRFTILVDGTPWKSFWEKIDKPLTSKPPKHTGGKPSYIKIMLKEVSEHPELSIEAAAFFIKTSNNVQWGDNLLIDKRSKKALTAIEIGKIVGLGKNKTLSVIKELREADLLIKDKQGYKISSCLVQKGGAKK
ncbi:MAG: hypothetical protein ABFD25_00920 [Clostridiaceae bacterium]